MDGSGVVPKGGWGSCLSYEDMLAAVNTAAIFRVEKFTNSSKKDVDHWVPVIAKPQQ